MINKRLKIYNKNKVIFRVSLFLITVISIVYFMPNELVFKQEFYKNTIWHNDDLIADFDFAIEKTSEEIQNEKEYLKEQKIFYYIKDPKVLEVLSNKIKDESKRLLLNDKVINDIANILDKEYEKGILTSNIINDDQLNSTLIIKSKNSFEAIEYNYDDLKNIQEVKNRINAILNDSLGNAFYEKIKPLLIGNLMFDKVLTDKIQKEKLDKLSLTIGLIKRGEYIIKKGDVVDEYKFLVLKSYKKQYEKQVWNEGRQLGAKFGYLIIVSLAILILFLYLYYFQNKIFQNNTQITFLIFNILFTVGLSVFAKKFFPNQFYIIPFCLQPIIVRSFFDQGTSIIIHIITILIISFLANNSFEFLYIQLIAGVVIILTNDKLHKRVNLYIAVVKITLIYEFTFLSGILIQEGTLLNFVEIWKPISHFFLSGIFTFLVLPLIYFYERIFGMMSDISLLELSDSNHPLLRKLANEAPGTLQHSMQVANLAEEAAIEVGGNALLVKIGAMYHDVGKLANPIFFIENQNHMINPHDDLEPEESADIIISHVIEGIEIAKKYKLPDRIIDFIRTHHGDSLVYYFYSKHKEKYPNEEVNERLFKYKGPKPFSKESAILMMCDSIEAASKSLKNPTSLDFEKLVNTIINKQLKDGQFDNADISLKEIGQIKKVLIKRLVNIYHVRIEYPE